MPDHTVESCASNPEGIDEAHAEIRAACAVFAGKWKLEILWLLIQRMHRFNELRRAIPGVTQHMLTQQLRELENDGMVRRTVYPEIPPRVEYQITEDARRLKPVFEAILMWSHGRSSGGERGAQNAAA
ncbi:winged helix-turn-helix transcriptional regulator [Lysobacter capsici]|uniref:winged helix-turn-helix transcriptional regulator n=1 Tax=Lysobacter capsici TaxID=435897 RepID=UPI001C001B22|nr:helix-turn-helix domain-containing protein [Lysobacter capsici]QWF17017.1 helix-turn-helix transcriptional regulator [Lysobacter capsici]